VNACPQDFRRMVQAALLTGCRYSELTNLRCADFNADSDTLTIRQAKAGKPRHVVLTKEGEIRCSPIGRQDAPQIHTFSSATMGSLGENLISNDRLPKQARLQKYHHR
jgi:Phage integrase family